MEVDAQKGQSPGGKEDLNGPHYLRNQVQQNSSAVKIAEKNIHEELKHQNPEAIDLSVFSFHRLLIAAEV